MCVINVMRFLGSLIFCLYVFHSSSAHAFRPVPGDHPARFFSLNAIGRDGGVALPSRYAPQYYPIAAHERTASMPVQVDHSVRNHSKSLRVNAQGTPESIMDKDEAQLLLFIFSAGE